MITLELIPSERLPGYIATNGIVGLCLHRLPNGKEIPAEVRRWDGEDFILDIPNEYDLSHAAFLARLSERSGLPVLPARIER